jgi:hypothetical protein
MALKMRGTRECLRTPKSGKQMGRSVNCLCGSAQGWGEAPGRSITFCKGSMLPVPPSWILTPQITQMSRDSRVARALKVREIDRHSGQHSEHSWKSSECRRHSVVGEFSEPLIDFIELSEPRNW